MYGHICTSAGISPREVGELTWREIRDLLDYWGDHPPIHILVGAYFKALGKTATTSDSETAAPETDEDMDLSDLIGMGLPIFQGKPPGALDINGQ